MLGVTAIDHICFTVPDLEQATVFFEEVIGARAVFRRLGPFSADDEPGGRNWMHEQLRMPPDGTLHAAILALGPDQGIELYEVDTPDQHTDHVRPQDVGAPHLSFRVRDFDAAYEALLGEERVTLHGEPQAADEGPLAGLRWVHFETPWGLVLEIDEWPASPYVQ